MIPSTYITLELLYLIQKLWVEFIIVEFVIIQLLTTKGPLWTEKLKIVIMWYKSTTSHQFSTSFNAIYYSVQNVNWKLR